MQRIHNWNDLLDIINSINKDRRDASVKIYDAVEDQVYIIDGVRSVKGERQLVCKLDAE